MIPHGTILAELARAKAIFQLRAVAAIIGAPAQGMSTDPAKTPQAAEGRSPASPVGESQCAQGEYP